MSTTNKSVLDFEDPGIIPDEFLDMPGVVNELKNLTLANAPRANEPLAFAGALAMLAHTSGCVYKGPGGMRTNLYLAALAPSGMGKDEPRVTNKDVAKSLGILGSLPEALASGEALEDAVLTYGTVLLQVDEADSLLTALRGSDSRASRMNEMILRFFSEAKSGHAVRIKAGDSHAKIIPQPHLSLFATGIPKFFYGALRQKSLENGLLGRCLVMDTDAFIPLGKCQDAKPSEELLAKLRTMTEADRKMRESGEYNLIEVTLDEAANARLDELRLKVDATTQEYLNKGLTTAAALYVRVIEKSLKVAMLGAISVDQSKPVVTLEILEKAYKLVCHITGRMLYESQFYVNEGAFDKLKKHFLGLLAKHNDQIDRTTALKNMNIDVGTFKKVVRTLEACDMIDEETLSSRKILYTLKDR